MEYVTFDRKATMRGANVLATVRAFRLVPKVVEGFFLEQGIELGSMTPEAQIPMQQWLNVLKRISEMVGPMKVRAVGTLMVSVAIFPPQFRNVEDVLLALNDIYNMNGTGNLGRYKVARVGEDKVQIECFTPFPRQFERGLVEGICRNERLSQGVRYEVDYADGSSDPDLTCSMTVSRV